MNNDHILSTFDNDLNRLNKDLLKLAKLATEQFVNSIDNFSTQNIDDIDQLISNDKNLDDFVSVPWINVASCFVQSIDILK